MEESSKSTQFKRLPDAWVAKLFQQLQGNYGTRFLNQWKTGQPDSTGADMGVINAMGVWADSLGAFLDNPEAIKVALQSLPPEPPSLPQFVEMCHEKARRMASAAHHAMLSAPPLSPETRADLAQKLEFAVRKAPAYDFKGWAKQLRAEYIAGGGLSGVQIERASATLGETWDNRKCTPALRVAA
jgi:hypothetical protein